MLYMVLYIVGLFHFCFANYLPSWGEDDDVKYLINFDSPLYAFGDDSMAFIDTTNVEVERYNDTTAMMFGDLKFLKILGKNVILEIVVKQIMIFGNSETVFTADICDFCAELSNPSSTYGKYLQFIGFPDDCPIGIGTYEIMNLCLDLDDFEVSSKNAGKYEAVINVFIRSSYLNESYITENDPSKDYDYGSEVKEAAGAVSETAEEHDPAKDVDKCEGDRELKFTLKLDLLIEPQ